MHNRSNAQVPRQPDHVLLRTAKHQPRGPKKVEAGYQRQRNAYIYTCLYTHPTLYFPREYSYDIYPWLDRPPPSTPSTIIRVTSHPHHSFYRTSTLSSSRIRTVPLIFCPHSPTYLPTFSTTYLHIYPPNYRDATPPCLLRIALPRLQATSTSRRVCWRARWR